MTAVDRPDEAALEQARVSDARGRPAHRQHRIGVVSKEQPWPAESKDPKPGGVDVSSARSWQSQERYVAVFDPCPDMTPARAAVVREVVRPELHRGGGLPAARNETLTSTREGKASQVVRVGTCEAKSLPTTTAISRAEDPSRPGRDEAESAIDEVDHHRKSWPVDRAWGGNEPTACLPRPSTILRGPQEPSP
jgi:hypothetical protein